MKRTKTQLEAQLITAQSLIVTLQEVNRAQLRRIKELEQTDRNDMAALAQDNLALGGRMRELEARLMARGGKLEMLQEMALELAHGYKKYR